MRAILLVAGILLSPITASAADEPAWTPTTCDAAGFHQMDFRIGTWTVKSEDSQGTSRIVSRSHGCILVEELVDSRDPQPYAMSMTSYHEGIWFITWIEGGSHFTMRGVRQPDGSFVVQSERTYEGRMGEPEGEMYRDEGVRIYYEKISSSGYTMRIQRSDTPWTNNSWKDFRIVQYTPAK